MLLDLHADGQPKENVRILDMGCGTGLTGQALVQKGFARVHGLDASPGMLKLAEGRGYEKVEQLYLGEPDSFPEELKDQFEYVTATAILAEGHCGPKVFQEMNMALKQGGHTLFTTREQYMDELGYRQAIKELVDEGKWKLVKEANF